MRKHVEPARPLLDEQPLHQPDCHSQPRFQQQSLGVLFSAMLRLYPSGMMLGYIKRTHYGLVLVAGPVHQRHLGPAASWAEVLVAGPSFAAETPRFGGAGLPVCDCFALRMGPLVAASFLCCSSTFKLA
ncbi:hypothetical protein AMTRI_Chr11g99530 [Amborella trichopoda]